MKNLILILSIILFTSCKSIGQEQQGYKIYRIENINSYYLIYCDKNGEKYKIVSKKEKEMSKNSSKIKIGKFYNLKLNLYHTNDNNPLTNITTTPYILRCYMFADTKICEEKDIKLYIAENLKGLYYVK